MRNSWSEKITIRDFCRRDLQAVLSLEAQVLSPWSRRSIEQDPGGDAPMSLVAALPGGQVAGWLSGRQVGDHGELLKITVDASLRRSGIARLLIRRFCHQLGQNGVKECFLEVRSENLPARRLYEHLGFCIVGYRPGYYKNPDDDACLARRALSPENLEHLSHEKCY